jgi:hypothetical protein
MTAGLPDTPPADPRLWAADHLGLDPDTPPREARAAFLRALPESDFVPPETWHEAVRVLSRSGAAGPPGAQALADFEEWLRDAVEEFAADFFRLPAAARRQRWQELVRRCTWSPPLSARLWALEPGLDIDRTRQVTGHPRAASLANHVYDLFVLRPADRATRGRAVVDVMRGEMAEWEAAARHLQDKYPAVAALEPGLVGRLAHWSLRRQRAARKRQRQSPVACAPTPAPAPSKGGGGGWGLAGILIGIVIALVRIVSEANKTPSPKYPEIKIPEFHAPDFQPPPNWPQGWPGGDKNGVRPGGGDRFFKPPQDQRPRGRPEPPPARDKAEQPDNPFPPGDPAP